MKLFNIYVLILLSFILQDRPVLEQGRAYAGIGGDMEVYDLSKTNGGDVYAEMALRKDWGTFGKD